MKTVVVGLSGGVDSSVAAYLLKEEGYNVIGLFMRNWNDESVLIDNECPWIEDSNDALEVAELLGIPFQVLDFSKEYKERIVDYMFREYKNGRTPNPDVLCNREVKFDLGIGSRNLQLLSMSIDTADNYIQETLSSFRKYVLDGFNKGSFKPVIDSVILASELPKAHKMVEERKHFGKIILKFD